MGRAVEDWECHRNDDVRHVMACCHTCPYCAKPQLRNVRAHIQVYHPERVNYKREKADK